MAKMNFEIQSLNMALALAREVINDHENAFFLKFLLDHKDFISGKSLVSFYNDFEQS